MPGCCTTLPDTASVPSVLAGQVSVRGITYPEPGQRLSVFVAVDAEAADGAVHRIFSRLTAQGSFMQGRIVECGEVDNAPLKDVKLSRPTDVTAFVFPDLGNGQSFTDLAQRLQGVLSSCDEVGAYEIRYPAGMSSGMKHHGRWNGRSLFKPEMR